MVIWISYESLTILLHFQRDTSEDCFASSENIPLMSVSDSTENCTVSQSFMDGRSKFAP